MIKNILILILLLIILSFVFLAYMGAFSKIMISQKEMGPWTYAYVQHRGSYREVSKPMTDLYNRMVEAGFNKQADGIAIYYDNPNVTPVVDLRADVGQVVPTDDLQKIEANKDKFAFGTLERKKYITAEFPLKNNLSYMLGPIVIYPKISQYAKENSLTTGAGIEYYDMTNKKIVFMMEVRSK